MKRIFVILLAVLMCCTVITGCSLNSTDNYTKNITVYSFSGVNEQFAISNGVIVLTNAEEIFYGGNLMGKKDYFSNITSFSMTFYIMSGDEKKILLSNSVEDMTGGTVNVAGETGKVSGDGIITGTKIDELEDLQNNLYFELITTDLNGEEYVYQLQLSLTEVTGKADT